MFRVTDLWVLDGVRMRVVENPTWKRSNLHLSPEGGGEAEGVRMVLARMRQTANDEVLLSPEEILWMSWAAQIILTLVLCICNAFKKYNLVHTSKGNLISKSLFILLSFKGNLVSLCYSEQQLQNNEEWATWGFKRCILNPKVMSLACSFHYERCYSGTRWFLEAI